MTRYEHDCDACTPLGEFKEFDLYVHIYEDDPEHLLNTVIARMGDEGPAYGSVPVMALRHLQERSEGIRETVPEQYWVALMRYDEIKETT